MIPHETQFAFLRDAHRFVGCAAGAQSGKTLAAAHKFAKRVIETYKAQVNAGKRGNVANFWVVTPTYELATVAQRYLRERWTNGWREKRAGIYLECEPYPGCIVKFRSAEHPDKLVSEAVDGLWLNETARMKADAWRGGLRMRLNATGGWMIWDTTPMGQNWIYSDLYLPGLRAGDREHDAASEDAAYRSYVWRTIDNPGVSASEVEQARARLPASFFAREYEADFSAFHGQVWPDFKKEIHSATKLRASDYPDVVLGVDWGFTPGHLGVILVVGVDRVKRRAGVIEEYAHDGWTDDRWQDLLVSLIEKHPVARVWCDPARPDELAGMRKRISIEVDRVRKSSGHSRMVPIREAFNEVYPGLMCIAELTHTGGLAVDPSCTTTIRQMLSYHWAKGTQHRGGEWQDSPAKVDDDTCDAARYGIYSELRRTEVSGR